MHLLARLSMCLLGLIALLTTPASADDIYNWSDTDSLNNRTPPNGWPAGMPLGQVEPTAQAMMGAIKRSLNTWDARQFGTSTGASDNSAAINLCLTTVGSGGTCVISQTLGITGSVTIPADTTLTCGFTFGDEEDAPANFGTRTALKLSSSATISAGGNNASILNCLVYRNGMTFPAADSTAYAGTALSDAGHGNFAIKDTVIVGFDRCVYITGTHPLVDRVYTDCAGSSNPAIDIENGNTDSGYFDRIKLQPLGTGNYNGSSVLCAASTRAGTGFKMNGINYVGSITSQNYRTTDIEMDSYTHADILWADFPAACRSTYPNSVGLKNTSILTVNEVALNGHGVGMVQSGLLHAGHILLNVIWGDCIQMPTSNSRTSVGYLETNDASGATNCGASTTGYAINYTDNSNTSFIYIKSASLKAVASTPYINIPSTISANLIDIPESVSTDTANPAALYGATTVGTLVGFGTGATASLTTGARTTPWKGQIIINTGTAPSTTFVSLQLTFPLISPNTANCIATPQAGADNWVGMNLWQVVGVSQSVQQIDAFLQGTAPAASHSSGLRINFECNPQ